MTIILLTAFLTIVVSFIFYKQLRQYHYFVYAFVGLLTLIIGGESANVVSMGYVPFGIFIVVMITGVMDKGIIKKRLLMVRA